MKGNRGSAGMLFLDTTMQKAALEEGLHCSWACLYMTNHSDQKKKKTTKRPLPHTTFRRNRLSMKVLAVDSSCWKALGGHRQERSCGQDGTGRPWSLPSQLFKTWQHSPQEHVGALQQQPTACFRLHQLKLHYQWLSPHFQYLPL